MSVSSDQAIRRIREKKREQRTGRWYKSLEIPIPTERWPVLTAAFPIPQKEWDEMMIVLERMKPAIIGESRPTEGSGDD